MRYLEERTLWFLLSCVCPFVCCIVNKIFCPSHISCPYPVVWPGHAVLWTQRKGPLQVIKYVLFTWAATRFKSLRVLFCYVMSPHLLSDDGAHRGEGSMKGSCQIIQVTTGALDESNQGLSWALAFSGIRCGNNFFPDSVLFKNENFYLIFPKHSLFFGAVYSILP